MLGLGFRPKPYCFSPKLYPARQRQLQLGSGTPALGNPTCYYVGLPLSLIAMLLIGDNWLVGDNWKSGSVRLPVTKVSPKSPIAFSSVFRFLAYSRGLPAENHVFSFFVFSFFVLCIPA